MREVPSYPFLEISREGRVRFKNSEHFLNIHHNHSSSVTGPAVYIRVNNSTTIVSVARILYETYIKESKMHRLETVCFKDMDESNLSLDNLELVDCRRKKPKRFKQSKPLNIEFDNWLQDSIYC